LIVSTVLRFSFLETVPCDRDENELFMHANDEDNDFNFYWFLDLSWEMKKTSGTVGQAERGIPSRLDDIESPQLVIQRNSQLPSIPKAASYEAVNRSN
jgi:hypothetical protein